MRAKTPSFSACNACFSWVSANFFSLSFCKSTLQTVLTIFSSVETSPCSLVSTDFISLKSFSAFKIACFRALAFSLRSLSAISACALLSNFRALVSFASCSVFCFNASASIATAFSSSAAFLLSAAKLASSIGNFLSIIAFWLTFSVATLTSLSIWAICPSSAALLSSICSRISASPALPKTFCACSFSAAWASSILPLSLAHSTLFSSALLPSVSAAFLQALSCSSVGTLDAVFALFG